MRTAGETTLTNFEDNIPQAMRQLNNWICWKIENRDGKPTKIPINPKTGGNAQSNNPGTWSDFQTAFNAWKRHRHSGIGFMFTQAAGIVGVDVDKCRDRETRHLSEQAKDILSTLNGYTEASPSGTGVHIIVKGKLPAGGRRNGNVEVYSEGRFFTITGKVLDGYSQNLEERSNELEAVHKKYIQKSHEPPQKRIPAIISTGIEQLIQKAMQSKTGYKFKALYEGNWQGLYSSQSEADQAFCNMLAFWMGSDPVKMDIAFRQSGLYRKKWDEKHGPNTYGNLTINEAIRNCRDTYIPEGRYLKKNPDMQPPELNICFMNTVPVKTVEWIPGWKPFLPRGKVVILEGDPGIGKTTIMCHISAELTRQGYTVVFQSAEDSLEDTVVPRMISAGADLTKLCCIRETVNTLTFTDERIEKLLEKTRPILATFDPVQAFMGAAVDMHRANEIRPIMQRLLILAERFNCTIVLCMHLNKSSNGKGLYRGLGSIDIAAAARSVILAGVDPVDPTKGALIHIKSSLAQRAKPKGFIIDDSGFRWTGDSELTEDQVLYGTKNSDVPKSKQAEKLLLEKLSTGEWVQTSELETEAKKLGISSTTLWEARKRLNVKAKKKNFTGPWYWFISPEDLDENQFLNKGLHSSESSEKKQPSNAADSRVLPKNRNTDSSSESSIHEEPERIFGESTDSTIFKRRIDNSSLLIHSPLHTDEDVFNEIMSGVKP